jgi:hypothetical protein
MTALSICLDGDGYKSANINTMVATVKLFNTIILTDPARKMPTIFGLFFSDRSRRLAAPSRKGRKKWVHAGEKMRS